MFEKVCAWKNVFVNLPTQKRAYVIPVSSNESTIAIWHQVTGSEYGKEPVSDILSLAAHKLKWSRVAS